MSSLSICDDSLFLTTPPILNLHKEESGIEAIKKLSVLASITTGIALGCMFIPNFALGLALGTAMLVTQIAVGLLFKKEEEKKDKEGEDSPFRQYLQNNLLKVAIFGPIYEEVLFRGILSPGITKIALLAIPAFAAPLCGLGISGATGAAIALTSGLFGAIHLANPHKRAKEQAVSAASGGVFLGLVSHYLGLGAACAAHIANNTVIALGLLFNSKPDLVPNKDRRLFPDFFNERKTTIVSKP